MVVGTHSDVFWGLAWKLTVKRYTPDTAVAAATFGIYLEWLDLDTNRNPSKTKQNGQIGEPKIKSATNGL